MRLSHAVELCTLGILPSTDSPFVPCLQDSARFECSLLSSLLCVGREIINTVEFNYTDPTMRLRWMLAFLISATPLGIMNADMTCHAFLIYLNSSRISGESVFHLFFFFSRASVFEIDFCLKLCWKILFCLFIKYPV